MKRNIIFLNSLISLIFVIVPNSIVFVMQNVNNRDDVKDIFKIISFFGIICGCFALVSSILNNLDLTKYVKTTILFILLFILSAIIFILLNCIELVIFLSPILAIALSLIIIRKSTYKIIEIITIVLLNPGIYLSAYIFAVLYLVTNNQGLLF